MALYYTWMVAWGYYYIHIQYDSWGPSPACGAGGAGRCLWVSLPAASFPRGGGGGRSGGTLVGWAFRDGCCGCGCRPPPVGPACLSFSTCTRRPLHALASAAADGTRQHLPSSGSGFVVSASVPADALGGDGGPLVVALGPLVIPPPAWWTWTAARAATGAHLTTDAHDEARPFSQWTPTKMYRLQRY